MFDILNMEFTFGMMDASTLHGFVDLGTITEEQYDSITKTNTASQTQNISNVQTNSANATSASSSNSASAQTTNIQQ